MREVNHRARNMLSAVGAIAHQSVAGNLEGYVGRFSERIRALAAYQDLLVRSEWHGVEIGDLARAQLSLFVDLIGSRIAKYGALSTNTGRIDIGWETDGDTLTISWTERGGPPVSAPKRRGFGTIVMEAMTERSVGGVVDLDYASTGLTWRLTCPSANALARHLIRFP
jgi:two-component sensor histidine kinase